MAFLDIILKNLPEVQAPTEKRLAFKEKLKWSLIILIAFFILGLMPLFGLGKSSLQQLEFFEVVLGASFGSLISLGIGPIVTASIVLQLFNGAGIVKFDLSTHEGKARFQGVQKLLSIFFIILEGAIYVLLGGLSPVEGFPHILLIFQLFIGGILIMFMDEVVSKWGFGSGISLFIAAGVSKEIIVRLISPLKVAGSQYSVGRVWEFFQALRLGDATTAGVAFFTILATVVVFLVVVYTQAMKVEIPLSFGRIRGYGIRWPLNFFYTSNIPVILMAALIANMQLLISLLGTGGFLSTIVHPPNIVQLIIGGGLTFGMIIKALIYLIIFMLGAMVFGIFWVQTSGLDARSQAKNIMNAGLQIPGFRKDMRVLENLLNRYIWPLTIMGGLAVGALAAIADLTGALGRGTGILLTVMIIYRLYEEIAHQHMMDMNPTMRKFMGGE